MIRVGVLGARGRMGTLTCSTMESAADLQLVAAVGRGDPLQELTESDVQVADAFSPPDVVLDQIIWCAERGLHVVVGSSGMSEARLDAVRVVLADEPDSHVLVVPNFSVGAVLMMRFAAQAARLFESVEIVELHHPDKVDAPSGTAQRTAEVVAQARRDAGRAVSPDATTAEAASARGTVIEDVRVHSVRLRGLTASQEVLLGNPGETLVLRHDMPGREAAMPGVLAAVRAVRGLPGLTVGLERVLGLD